MVQKSGKKLSLNMEENSLKESWKECRKLFNILESNMENLSMYCGNLSLKTDNQWTWMKIMETKSTRTQVFHRIFSHSLRKSRLEPTNAEWHAQLGGLRVASRCLDRFSFTGWMLVIYIPIICSFKWFWCCLFPKSELWDDLGDLFLMWNWKWSRQAWYLKWMDRIRNDQGSGWRQGGGGSSSRERCDLLQASYYRHHHRPCWFSTCFVSRSCCPSLYF